MGVISIKLQSGFVGMTILGVCSPVGWLCICRVPLLENTSGGLLLSMDNFIYNFISLLGECLLVKRVLKDLNYKELVFTIVKINLPTHTHIQTQKQ